MKKKGQISIVSLIQAEGKWYGGERPGRYTSGYLQVDWDKYTVPFPWITQIGNTGWATVTTTMDPAARR